MDSYALIVIDMQPEFDAASDSKTLHHCRAEIRRAIAHDMPIVFVEYDGSGATHKTLTNVVKNSGYNKVHFCYKWSDDGSEALNKLLKKKKLPRTRLRVCGVNTDCCVFETVEGLVKSNRGKILIEVATKACGSINCHKEGLDSMKDLKNVVLV